MFDPNINNGSDTKAVALELYWLGQEAFGQQRYIDSIRYFEEASRLYSCFPEALRSVGEVFDQLAFYDIALLYYRDAFEAGPQGLDDYIWLTERLLSVPGNLPYSHDARIEAAQVMSVARDLFPSSSTLHFHSAHACGWAGLFAEAISHYNMAVELETENAERCAGIGQSLHMYATSGKIEGASMSYVLAAFDKAILIDPQFARAYALKGDAITDPEESLTLIEKAFELDPADETSEILTIRAQKYVELGLFDEALRDFLSLEAQEKAEQNSYYTHAAAQIGICYYELGKFELALEYLDRALEGERQRDGLSFHRTYCSGYLYYYRGKVLLGVGETEQGLVDIREAASLGHVQAAELLRSMDLTIDM